jgi:hypothetical protein
MKRPVKSRGRPPNPAKAAIDARYGGRDNVARWNDVAKSLGSAVPWDDGPGAVKAWIHRNGKAVPAWLVRIIAKEDASDPGADAPIPDDESNPSVLKGILDSLTRRIRKAETAGADSGVLSLLGKDFTKVHEQYLKALKDARQNSTDYVLLSEVVDVIDTIHAAIPDRIEAALLNSEAEARAALAAGSSEWRAFTGRFRQHTLGDLADRSFGVMFKETDSKTKR